MLHLVIASFSAFQKSTSIAEYFNRRFLHITYRNRYFRVGSKTNDYEEKALTLMLAR
jgi:hypothetical protein